MQKAQHAPFLVLLLFIFVGLFFGSGVFAAEVVFENDTTVTVGGNNYIILAGSEADSVEAGTSTVTVSVPSGSTLTFQSSDRHILGNNGGITQSCTAEDSRLTIQGPRVLLVITPDSGQFKVLNVTDMGSQIGYD